MKKISPLWASLLAVGVILGLVAASGTGSKLIYQARHTFRTERFLSVEGDRLVYNKQTWGSAPERSSLKKLKASPLTAKSTGSAVEITFSGKIFRRTAMANDIIVSPKNQTVFYTEYEMLPTSKSGRPTAYPRLFQWTELGGFESLNPPGVGTSSPRLSVDEQVLFLNNYSMSHGADGTMVYDIKTKRTSPFKQGVLNAEAILNPNAVLEIDRNSKSADDAFGQLVLFDWQNKKSEQILPGQLAGRVTTFDGAIWVLLKTPTAKYEVVRLSSDLKRIEETIAVK